MKADLTIGPAFNKYGGMSLHPIDYAIIVVYLAVVAAIGISVKKQASKKLDSYYLADRNIPWWMLVKMAQSSLNLIKPHQFPYRGPLSVNNWGYPSAGSMILELATSDVTGQSSGIWQTDPSPGIHLTPI